MRLALLLLTLSFALLTGCGSDGEHGTDEHGRADTGALESITKALETMFTWEPGKDTSSADAFARAEPYLTDELKGQTTKRSERGPGLQWSQWATAQATVKAQAVVVAAEHEPDEPDRITREVTIIQTITAPDKTIMDTLQIDTRATAVKTSQGWRVATVDFL